MSNDGNVPNDPFSRPPVDPTQPISQPPEPPSEPPIEPPVEPTEPLIVPMSDDPIVPGEPTRVMPVIPPTAAEVPVIAGAAAAAPPPGGPIDPVAPGEDEPWYRDPRGRAAMVGAGLAALLILIVALVWWGNDDDGDVTVGPSSTSVPSTSVAPSTSLAPSTSVAPETTLPPTTAPTSTVAETTTTTTSTTTTTLPPTTTTTEAPATTTSTAAPTTTTIAATTTTTVPAPVVTSPADPSATLLDIINNTPDLSGVKSLVDMSGFAPELDADEPRTFFAPSNAAIEAYAATPAGQAVLQDPDKVRDLLMGQLVLQALTASQLWSMSSVEMADGASMPINGGAKTIDGAQLLVTDVGAANGTLQVTSELLGV